MHRIASYLPQDRLRALAKNTPLPTHTHGSAIFADISGFTLLTEKLTQTLGSRKGVDALSRQLNQVYTALVNQVESYGGSIISFAGDAIICWFDDAVSDSTPLMAASCAQDMQAAMQEFEELTLKIVITTGTARRFATGDPNIQLLDALTGRTISRLTIGERLAHRGEILVDEATCASLAENAQIIEERTDAGTLEKFSILDSIRTPAEPHTSFASNSMDLPVENLRPWLLPAVYGLEQNERVSFLTELRPAVPVFVNFSGIDYDEDEDAEQKLNAFIRHAQHVITKYDGALLQLVIGDKGSYFYSVFGAPTAHEDDASRAVYAALEIEQTLKQFEYIQSLQIGVSLGTLRVGAYGGSTRRTYAALGDDVNLAARLMMTAAPNEILITGRVQHEIQDIFIFDPHEAITMKGKGEPQPVFAVTGIVHQRATRLPEPTYRLPMYGRQNELALVEEKLKPAKQGRGQVIGIIAEAGMGKSRLIAEIIRLARKSGFIGYGGACQSAGTNTPYLVWQSIWQAFFDLDLEMPQKKQLRLLEGEIEDRAPKRVEALPLLGLVLDLPLPDNDFTRMLDPKDRKNTLEILLEDCLQSAARETPLLIVLEDLHWIDPLSQDLLETLARVSENLSVCFVLAYRPPDAIRSPASRVEMLPYFTRIELKELSTLDAEQLIRAKLAQLFPERIGAPPKELTEELALKSQGNPFFIEELLNYLHDKGLNPYDAHILKGLELPASLQTLILSRIDQLAEPQKVTLKVASVIGRVFPFSWLHGYYPSLGKENIVKEQLSELSKLDLTPLDTPDPELAYIFKHIVTQEVAYESLSFATRAQLHELLARYLESIHPEDPPLDALAFHYGRSENIPKKREYLRKSAEAASAVYSNDTALEYFKQVLVLLPERDESIDVHLKSGTILQMIGRREDAAAHFQAALQTAEADNLTERIVECRIKVGNMCTDYQQSLEWLNQAYELARRIHDSKGICDALNELSNIHWRLGNFDTALQHSQQSLALARQISDRQREAMALFFMATIHSERGDYAESHKFFEATLAIGRELNDPRRIGSTLLNWGTTYYYQGDYETAQKHYQESLVFYREIGDKRSTTLTLNNLGNIFYLQNNYQTARMYYLEALTLGRETADSYTMSIALASLGITAFQEGSLDEAEKYYQEATVLSRALNHQITLSLLYCYQGLLALARMRVVAARKSFHEGLAIAHQSDMKAYIIYNLIGCACVYLAEDKPSHTATLLGASSAIASSIGFKLETELARPYDEALVSAKQKLSEADFHTALEIGKTMTPEQAVQFALAANGNP